MPRKKPGGAPAKTPKKIAILGTTPSRMEAPLDDDSGWEIWTIGPGGKDAHRWDRLFEVHGTWPLDFEGYLNDLSEVKPPQRVVMMPQPGRPSTPEGLLADWARSHGVKLEDHVKGDLAAVEMFPREHILAKYYRRMWFSSSIAWLIPLALEEGATDIGMWGIDLESGEEYISQFAGCAHFLDLAMLIGVNIHLPPGCGLLRDPSPYPDRYETLFALTVERKIQFLSASIGRMSSQYDSAKAEFHRQEGRVMQMRESATPPKTVTEAEVDLTQKGIQMDHLSANLHQLRGEQSACEFMKRMFVSSMQDPE